MTPRNAARLPRTPVLIGCTRRHDGQPLTIYQQPIRDGIRFCQQILDETMRNWGMHLELEEYEDSISELLIIALKLEAGYDPTRNNNFAAYARSILERRAVDAGPRRILGRTGTRLAERQHEELDDSNIGLARPLFAQPGETSHTPDHHSLNRPGLHRNGTRPSTGAYTLLGIRTRRRNAPRAVSAGSETQAA